MNNKIIIVKYDITNKLSFKNVYSIQYIIYIANVPNKCMIFCLNVYLYVATQLIPNNIIMLIYELLTSAFFLANMS